MIVRRARGGDTFAVLQVWKAARSAAASTPDDPAAVAEAIDAGALLVAQERDGEIVGTIIAGWDGWRGNLYRLAVLPDHRRLGIGRELVDAAEELLRRRGARRITALVGRGDPVAMALWRHAGYAHDTQVARFVKNL